MVPGTSQRLGRNLVLQLLKDKDNVEDLGNSAKAMHQFEQCSAPRPLGQLKCTYVDGGEVERTSILPCPSSANPMPKPPNSQFQPNTPSHLHPLLALGCGVVWLVTLRSLGCHLVTGVEWVLLSSGPGCAVPAGPDLDLDLDPAHGSGSGSGRDPDRAAGPGLGGVVVEFEEIVGAGTLAYEHVAVVVDDVETQHRWMGAGQAAAFAGNVVAVDLDLYVAGVAAELLVPTPDHCAVVVVVGVAAAVAVFVAVDCVSGRRDCLRLHGVLRTNYHQTGTADQVLQLQSRQQPPVGGCYFSKYHHAHWKKCKQEQSK